MYLSDFKGVKRPGEVAIPAEGVPLWQKVPEGLRLILTGALGGLMIGALIGVGLLGVV